MPRVLPAGLGACVDPATWRMPSVMRLLGALGAIEDDELRATFNGGVGMILIVRPDDAAAVIEDLAAHGVQAWRIGEVRPADELGGRRYLEASSGRA